MQSELDACREMDGVGALRVLASERGEANSDVDSRGGDDKTDGGRTAQLEDDVDSAAAAKEAKAEEVGAEFSFVPFGESSIAEVRLLEDLRKRDGEVMDGSASERREDEAVDEIAGEGEAECSTAAS